MDFFQLLFVLLRAPDTSQISSGDVRRNRQEMVQYLRDRFPESDGREEREEQKRRMEQEKQETRKDGAERESRLFSFEQGHQVRHFAQPVKSHRRPWPESRAACGGS